MAKNLDASELFAGAFAVCLVLVVLCLLMALPVMLLWNAILPDITRGAVTELTFWQALGLNLLCSILFKPSSKNQ